MVASLPNTRCTAPITCASEASSALVAEPSPRRPAPPCRFARLRRAAPTRQAPPSPTGRLRVRRARLCASATSGKAPCLPASKACVFSPIMLTSGFLNSAQEPVVKSCRRVPTASTRSAASASRLEAEVPVTPTAPMLSGWPSGSDDLPACVSQNRDAMPFGKGGQLRRCPRIEHAAAGDDHRLLRAALIAAAAAAVPRRSGRMPARRPQPLGEEASG